MFPSGLFDSLSLRRVGAIDSLISRQVDPGAVRNACRFMRGQDQPASGCYQHCHGQYEQWALRERFTGWSF
ncbi:hypothetical protein [Nitrospira lenta]|uniref:hypothetical protein n=1 Tax=Nitrospira lenta TaxID=1436998 RepID=UPI000EFAC2FD|nr:hypothetical protein [Nitrospira lenta]